MRLFTSVLWANSASCGAMTLPGMGIGQAEVREGKGLVYPDLGTSTATAAATPPPPLLGPGRRRHHCAGFAAKLFSRMAHMAARICVRGGEEGESRQGRIQDQELTYLSFIR